MGSRLDEDERALLTAKSEITNSLLESSGGEIDGTLGTSHALVDNLNVDGALGTLDADLATAGVLLGEDDLGDGGNHVVLAIVPAAGAESGVEVGDVALVGAGLDVTLLDGGVLVGGVLVEVLPGEVGVGVVVLVDEGELVDLGGDLLGHLLALLLGGGGKGEGESEDDGGGDGLEHVDGGEGLKWYLKRLVKLVV